MCLQVLQSCGSPELVRSVIAPHLSKDAVDFLRGHLTPKEMTIFELLGDGWTKSRYNVIMCILVAGSVCACVLLKGDFFNIPLLHLLQGRVAQGSVRCSLLPKVS